MKLNFTQRDLEKLECPATSRKQIVVGDVRVRGLALRVTPGGSKQYIYYRRLPKDNESPAKICEITLGKFEDLTIEQARARAEQLNSIVGQRKDPSREANDELSYDALFQRYLDQYARLHTTSWENAVYNHKKYFGRFSEKSVTRIKRSDVELWMKDLAETTGRDTANRNYNTLRAVFSWGLRRGLIFGENPCLGISRFKALPRERFLTPGDEFQRFADALAEEPNETIRDFFWMCLFTGARRSNVLAMEWNQVNLDLLIWRIPQTKNGDSLTIPLTPNAAGILRRRLDSEDRHPCWVFPSDRRGRKSGERGHLISPKKAWARILDRAGIKDLRIHDLRRTAGSYMAIQGVSPAIIGKALGHKSPQSTAIYARLTQDPVRQALENAQSAFLDPRKLLPKKASVTKLKRGEPHDG